MVNQGMDDTDPSNLIVNAETKEDPGHHHKNDFDPKEETLIEFDPPQLLRSSSSSSSSDMPNFYQSPHHQTRKHSKLMMQECPVERPLLQMYKDEESEMKEELNQLLDMIHGPQDWIGDDNKHYIRYISPVPAYPSKAVELDLRLEILLKERRVGRPGSLCPIRRQLFDDCFDELIRQITLNTPERGMLLIRCRDELRATRTAYTALFGSSECFLSRKCGRERSAKLAKNVEILRTETVAVRKTLAQLQDSMRVSAGRHAEEMEKLERKNNEELEYFKITNSRLKAQFDTFKSPGRLKLGETPVQKITRPSRQLVKKYDQPPAKRQERLLSETNPGSINVIHLKS